MDDLVAPWVMILVLRQGRDAAACAARASCRELPQLGQHGKDGCVWPGLVGHASKQLRPDLYPIVPDIPKRWVGWR